MLQLFYNREMYIPQSVCVGWLQMYKDLYDKILVDILDTMFSNHLKTMTWCSWQVLMRGVSINCRLWATKLHSNCGLLARSSVSALPQLRFYEAHEPRHLQWRRGHQRHSSVHRNVVRRNEICRSQMPVAPAIQWTIWFIGENWWHHKDLFATSKWKTLQSFWQGLVCHHT